MKISNILVYLLCFLLGAFLFMPYLGYVHLFDWDEINFAESAREMMVTGDYLNVRINYESFWEKPPLFFWLQVISANLFGMNEFAMRFPNAIAGIFTMILLFRVGKRIIDEKFGLLWILVYIGSILPFFYFKSGIIDPWFNLFIFAGISYFSYYFIFQEKRKQNLLLSAVFLGLAILTKGPVAFLILILVFFVYLGMVKGRIPASFADIALFSGVLIFVGGFWFLLQIINGNFHILRDFIIYQIRLFQTEDAGHGGFLLYHFVVLFLGVFPASVFALPALFRPILEFYRSKSYGLWMRILFWVVLILFTIVNTKILHYSSLCYFPLTFLATKVIYRIFQEKLAFKKFHKILLTIIASFYALIVSGISLFGRFKDQLAYGKYIDDPFAIANLEAEVNWSGYESLIGIVFLGVMLYLLFGLKKMVPRIIGIFIASLIFTFLTIMIITPKIEGYSQRAAIEFYKSLSEEDVYVETLGFKSYGNLFYSKMMPSVDERSREKEWLLTGDIDKPAYFVFKVHHKERYMEKYPQLEILYEKNGFVFTKRKEGEVN